MDNTLTRESIVNTIVDEQGSDILRKSHMQNIHTLYINRDGSVFWSEEVSSNTWLEGDNISSIYSTGTGSVPCNCDWCSGDNAVDSLDEISFEADEYDYLTESLTRGIDEIEEGWFDFE